MASPLSLSVFFLVALCRCVDVATAASLQTPQQASVQLTQSVPAVEVPAASSAGSAVRAVVKDDLDDLIEDPAFIEELLKNIEADVDNDTSSDIDDKADDVGNNSTEVVNSEADSSSKELLDDADKEKDDDTVLFHVLHDVDDDADDVGDKDADTTNSNEGDSKEEVSAHDSDGGSSNHADDNDLFDILYEEDDNQWSLSQLAKKGKMDSMPGQCPVYPVRIEASQITIDTQDGCQIVIELSGQTVQKVSTMTDGEVKMKRLLSGTKVAFLAIKDDDEIDKDNTENSTPVDEDDDKQDEDDSDDSEMNDTEQDAAAIEDGTNDSTEAVERDTPDTDVDDITSS